MSRSVSLCLCITWHRIWTNVEPEKTYTVRLFCHNNSRIESNIAEDVRLKFLISDTKYVKNDGLYVAAVHGSIESSNAVPSLYSDGVKFVTEKPFRLEYILGTAIFANNAIANRENGYYQLDDAIVGNCVTIGYDAMDGKIPACYQYATSITTIKVMPVFE